MHVKLLGAMEGRDDASRTARWAVAQLRELHPVFFAALEASQTASLSDAALEANDEIEVSTGQAMSL